MQNRDKLGRFTASGESNPFNRKWVRRDKVIEMAVVKVDSDAIEKAYKTGFNTARRLPITHNAKSCYEAYIEYGDNE